MSLIKFKKVNGKKVKVLGETHNILNLILNTVPQFIFWKDTKCLFAGCNNGFAKMNKLEDSKDIVGKNDFDFLCREDAKKHMEIDNKIIKKEIPEYNSLEMVTTKCEKKIWINLKKKPLYDKQGNIIGVLANFEDMTGEICLGEKLKKSEEKYRNLLEFTNTAYIIMNEKLEIVEANTTFSNLMGFDSHENALGRNIRAWIIKEDIEKFDNSFSELLKGKAIDDLEIQIINESGQIICISLIANLTENGIKKIFCLVRDISKRKVIEQQKYIEEQRQRDRIRKSVSELRDILKKHSMG